MIRLFIENQEIELNETVQVAITKQFEDLSNPTTIINDWSKTVSIPFSQKNNEIFGHIYNPDKVIVEGGTVGIYFNPLLKLNFRLEWNSAVVMTGYAKMNEVKQTSGKGTYEITLFGELGKVFQEMKKITFDTSTTDTDYLINGADYVDEYITKDLVAQSWSSNGQWYSTLQKKGDSHYSITDIIGFAPNNSFSDGFDYKTYEASVQESKLFTDTLGTGFTAYTGVEPETAIPNGLLPREIGEYRSYLQLPFIYWNKLFQIFQEKAESVTGYRFNLDDSWFNNSNPYWYNLVYMLKPFDTKSEETVINYYKIAPRTSPGWGGQISAYTQPSVTPIVFVDKNEVVPIVDSNNIIQLSDDYAVMFNSTYTIELDISNYTNLRINPANGLQYSIRVLDENSNVLKELKWLMVDTQYAGSTSGYEEVIRFERQGAGAFRYYPKLNLMLNKGEFGDKVKLDFRAVWLNQNAPFLDNNNQPFMPTPSSYMGYINLHLYNAPTNNPISCNIISNRKRSYSHFTLNDLWNKDYNLFDAIIKYCKMYRIAISVDELNKTVDFMPYTKWFENYTVEDWTNKVDKSRDFVITPITFDNKYVLFNYKDSETKSGKEYKEKYGVNYGEYRLITDYNFNNEITNLFEDVTPSITNTDNVLSWNNLYTNHKIIYSFPAEIFVYNKDDDGKQVDIFGAYFFHNGVAEFSTEEALYMRNVYLSDDTQFQNANNKYFYVQRSSVMEQVSTYPKLDIVRNDNLCIFNVPKENYTYLNNYADKYSIYTNLWENYLNERYNIQNKKITCYVMLKPHEYCQFLWNKLIKICNQLCIVNKIYDYDITNNEPTKVDLITIQDIGGYNETDYTYDYIIASQHELTIPYDYYRKITVKSSGNWEIRSGDWTDVLAVFPTTGTSGETTVFIGSTDEEYGGTLYFDLLSDDETEVIGTDDVICRVGGTSTISVSSWYNEIVLGGRTTVTVSDSSTDGWRLIASYKQASNVVFLPQSGGTGDTTINLRQLPLHATTGVNDYYLENGNGDIVSFRLNVVNS